MEQLILQTKRAKFSSILHADGAPNHQSKILLHPPSRWSNSFSKLTELNSPPSSMDMELQIGRAEFSSIKVKFSFILHADGVPNRQSKQHSSPSSMLMELQINRSKILLHPPSRWSNSFSKPTKQNSPPSSMQMELQINRAKSSSILQTDGATHSQNQQSKILLHPPCRWVNSFSKPTEQKSPPSSMQMELQIIRAKSSSILQVDGATHSPNQQSKILLHPPCRWSSKSTEQNHPPSSKQMEQPILQTNRAKFSSILHADGAPNQQSKILLHPPNTWSYSSSKLSEQNPPPSSK